MRAARATVTVTYEGGGGGGGGGGGQARACELPVTLTSVDYTASRAYLLWHSDNDAALNPAVHFYSSPHNRDASHH